VWWREVLMTTALVDERRFTAPLYTVTEASRYLRIPASTLSTWADGYEHHRTDRDIPRVVVGAPIITALPKTTPGRPRLPFVGLAEAYVLAAFRQAGVPMQRIRPSLDWLVDTVGPHALASKALFTDGAEVLWDFGQRAGEDSDGRVVARNLVVPRLGQYVFQDVVERYLKQIRFARDDYAEVIRLPQYERSNVVLDPRRGYGQPIFDDSGVKLTDALGPIRAGESFEAVALDYGVDVDQLRDAYSLSA
jgi:uncharacterized protein (DUF433 family)